MRIRIITAAVGALALAACSGGDDARQADPAADAAVAVPAAPADGVMAPATGSAAPADPATLGNPDDAYPPGQTPPTLPTEPSTTSPATSPPPQ